MQSTKNQIASLQKRSSPDDRNPDLIPLSKGNKISYRNFKSITDGAFRP